ncbi:MAG: DUF1700 domain-containing protein [Oscillospiraceae bacterium]|nr:DUF1700 domain-containing protein [Oscillospiraceae bacterium]
MTKSEYLNTLKHELKFKLPEEEIRDIISDMEECFEAGKTDGKTESQIIYKLGTPDRAAEAIIAEKGEALKIPKVLLTEYWMPVILCLVICGAFVFLARNVQEIMIFSFVVPFLMWLALEQKNFIKGLTYRKADGFMLGAAFMLIMALVTFGQLPLGLKGIDRDTFVQIPLVNVFIFGFSVLSIISIFKNTKKLFCLVPLLIGAASAVNNISLFSCMATIDKVLEFNPYLYKYYARYICIFAIAVIFTIVLNAVKKNSFTIPIFFLTLFSSLCLIDWYKYLTRLDPANITRGNLDGGMPYLIYGIISCAITAVCVIVMKAYSKKKVGEG